MLAPIVERRKLLTSDTPMTIKGVASKTAFLFALTALAGVAMFWYADALQLSKNGLYSLSLFSLIAGLVLMLTTAFKSDLSKWLCVPYALFEGVAFGAFSGAAFDFMPSIPLNAFFATITTAFCVLGLYVAGVIKVSKNFRAMTLSAISALLVLYSVQLSLKLLGQSLPLLFDGGVVGIGFSLASICLASCCLVLDFDEVEQSTALNADKGFEWVYAMGLLSTLIWIYFQFLRLFRYAENGTF